MMKSDSLRTASPTLSVPKWAQSTWASSPMNLVCGRYARFTFGLTSATRRLSCCTEPRNPRSKSIWCKRVPQSEVDTYRRDFNVISSRYADGHSLLHVLSSDRPDAGFEAVSGDLQDVYFAMTAEKAGA